MPGPTAYTLSCQKDKSKAKKIPENTAYIIALRLLGKRCLFNFIKNQKIKEAISKRQNAMA